MDQETDAGEAVAQVFDLPEFEGTMPVGVDTRINGSGQRIIRPLGLEQRVILVVEAVVSGVDHKTVKGGIKRVHTLSVADLYEVEGKEGTKLLSNMRLRQKKADDARSGRKAIPGIDEATIGEPGPEVTVDGNGVAMTEAEVAAARGEEAPTNDLITEGPEPVTLVFKDGSRAAWPADYAQADLEREPYAGEFWVNPNSDSLDELQVEKVLDVDTGEAIEVWTEEQENARLLSLETALKAEEDAEEAAAEKAPKAKKSKGKLKSVPEGDNGEQPEPELPGDES